MKSKIKQRVFQPEFILFTSFLFGPFLGVYLYARNTKILGNLAKAKKIFVIGSVVVTVWIAALVALVPEDIDRSIKQLLPWTFALVIYAFAVKQKPAITISLQKNPIRRQTTGKYLHAARALLGGLLIGLLSIAATVLVVIVTQLVVVERIYNKEQHQAYLAGQERAAVERDLVTYTSKDRSYSLKLPKDFRLVDSNKDEDVIKSTANTYPFLINVYRFPKDSKFVYINDAVTFKAITDFMADDNSYVNQRSFGLIGGSVVYGQIDIHGTKHKNAVFLNGGFADPDGKEYVVRSIFIPKDDGTVLEVAAFISKDADAVTEPIIDGIFKTINVNP